MQEKDYSRTPSISHSLEIYSQFNLSLITFKAGNKERFYNFSFRCPLELRTKFLTFTTKQSSPIPLYVTIRVQLLSDFKNYLLANEPAHYHFNPNRFKKELLQHGWETFEPNINSSGLLTTEKQDKEKIQ